MNILLLGATGGTGRHLLKQCLEAGHTMTVLVRNPAKLPQDMEAVRVVVGDATDSNKIREALDANEILISALGATNSSVMTKSTKAILAAAEGSSLERIIMLSSFAVKQAQLTGPARLLTTAVMKKIIDDKNRAEELLRSSGITWTVVYATTLTNNLEPSNLRVIPENEKIRMRDSVARTNVAKWILSELVEKSYTNNDVVITQ